AADGIRSIDVTGVPTCAHTYDATGFTTAATLANPNAGSAGVDGSGAAFNEFEGLGDNDTITGNGNTRITFSNAFDGVTVDLSARSEERRAGKEGGWRCTESSAR